ncbi:hypothetical protein [Sporomusa termitida]|uniref:Uncharacterized protein n=1 Tax=Sporomusa termitida TaxID=2377 RepID=A0A517DT84_9FIRM|nr:hypothetical protein [Sporomusa termitida]QDR80560.1 hypothetical protein SPTER_18890 [Sporomusa termitida]
MTKQEQINRLTQKLLDCGYRSSQVKQIISEASENTTTAASSSQQEELIIEALQSYVEFGIKCKKKGARD